MRSLWTSVAFIVYLLLLSANGKGDERTNDISQAAKKENPLSISLEPLGVAKSVKDQEFRLIIKNVGENEIVLDARGLYWQVLCRVVDQSGKTLPNNLPPHPPKFSEEQMVKIGKGEELPLMIRVGNVTQLAVDGNEYEIFCEYDATNPEYSKDLPIWKGKWKSPVVKFGVAK